MELNVHPWWLSFIRNLTVFSLACSTKTAIPLSSPATVPTNTSGGFSGSAGLAGSTGLAMTGGAATIGGRREGEKIGRSRVIDNLDSGMAKTGLPMEVVASDGFFCGSGRASPDLDCGRVYALVNCVRARRRSTNRCCAGKNGQDKCLICEAQDHFTPCHCPETKIDTRIFSRTMLVPVSGACATS